MQDDSQRIPKNVVTASILLALFADTKILNLIVLAARPSLAGLFMTAMYGFVVIGLFVTGVFFQGKSLRSLSSKQVGITFLCIMWYFCTLTFVGQPSVAIQFFSIFMIAAFLIPGIITIDVRTFLLALLVLPSVGVFFLDQIIYNSILEEGILSMGTCYAMLVPVLANLVYLRYYYMKERILIKIILLPLTAINLYYLIQMSMFGFRGPLLCVILLIASFFLFEIHNDCSVSFNKRRSIIIVICIILLSVFFVQILQYLSDFFAHYNISINAINKFLRLEDGGDMSNGRDEILRVAWDAIWNSPLFGYGTSQFERNTGIVYPHNFIIQMLYDGGLILTLCILIPIIRSLINKIRVIIKEEFVALLLLFFVSVPAALFSGDLWISANLWMFFGFILTSNNLYKTL